MFGTIFDVSTWLLQDRQGFLLFCIAMHGYRVCVCVCVYCTYANLHQVCVYLVVFIIPGGYCWFVGRLIWSVDRVTVGLDFAALVSFLSR